MAIPRFKLNRKAATAQGLVGLWGPGSPSGVTLFDHSGRGNSGTLTNMEPGTDWVLDPERGWVLDFDGSDDFIDLNQRDALKPTTGISVAAWVRRDGSQGGYAGIVSSVKDGGGNGGYILVLLANKADFYIREGSAWKHCNSDAVIPDEVNTHIVGTWDGTTLRMWVDGIEQADTDTAASINYAGTNSNATIGQYSAVEYKGEISDARIYNRALSSGEVQHIYQATLREPYGDFILPRRPVFKSPKAPRKIYIIGGGISL